MLLSQPSFHFDTLPFSSFLTHTLYPLSFLISSFHLLSYSIHHIILSSSHSHSYLISSPHTSHRHSHSLLSHCIHLFILITFHAFSHHLICITLITSHIHLSFIPHHPYSILLPFHHSRIFIFRLIHFTMVLFAISSKLIFTHFIYHTLLFIIPSSFRSYFNSITLITTHLCFSFPFASMFSIHSFAIPLLTHLSHIFSVALIGNTLCQLDVHAYASYI